MKMSALGKRFTTGSAFLILSAGIFHATDALADSVIFQQTAASTGAYTMTNTEYWGQGFTIGATPMAFTSVDLALTAGGPGSQFFVDLYSDNAGHPGSVLEVLSGNNNPTTSADYLYTSTGTLLSANTTYWIVAGINPAGTSAFEYWNQINSAPAPSVGSGPGLRFSLDGGSSWNNQAGVATVMTVRGTTAVPEPCSMGLLAMAGVGMLNLRRRQSKRG